MLCKTTLTYYSLLSAVFISVLFMMFAVQQGAPGEAGPSGPSGSRVSISL